MQGLSTVLTAAGGQHGRHLASAQTAGLAWRASDAQTAPELLVVQPERVLILRTTAVCACCALLQAQHTQEATGCIAASVLPAATTAATESARMPVSCLQRTCHGAQMVNSALIRLEGHPVVGGFAAGGQPPGGAKPLLQQILCLGQPCAAKLQTNKNMRCNRGFCTHRSGAGCAEAAVHQVAARLQG